MPKELTTASSSGFALALDQRVLNRAKAPVDQTKEVKGISPVIEFPVHQETLRPERGIQSGESAKTHQQFILTDSTAAAFETLVSSIAGALKCRGLTRSHIMRSVIKAIQNSNLYIVHEISKCGPQKVPSNAKGFENERDNLETKIAMAIVKGFRDSPAPETE
jgi:hypothetical protein